MEIRVFGLVLLVLCISLPDEAQNCERFKSQHICYPQHWNSCDQRMESKEIESSEGNCKDENTFVLDSQINIRNVCRGQGTCLYRNGSIFQSNRNFQLVRCRYQGGTYSRFRYHQNIISEVIKVACSQGFPVHYVPPRNVQGPVFIDALKKYQ